MDFKESPAIFIQIADYMCEQILLKNWKPGERIVSIRDLAVSMEVNPNTVQRACDFLQRRNIIIQERGVGFFVEKDAMERILVFRREQFMENDLPVFFKNIYLLKIDFKEIKILYEQFAKNSFKNKSS